MKLGIAFPYQVIYGRAENEGTADHRVALDPAVLRDWAQAVEGLGYDFITLGDHVLLPDQGYHQGLLASYTHESIFREPFVLFSFLAALTTKIQFASTILIAPQRQTALMAKQAAELDLLSGGRLILGIGSGWNPVEFEALGQPFRTRARRMEEQIGLLRRYWTEPMVSFEGRFDKVTRAALNPRPSRAIPIWLGSEGRAALDRVGRLADGWVPRGASFTATADEWERKTARRRDAIFLAAEQAGRDPKSLDICLPTHGETLSEQAASLPRLAALGATHCVASGAPQTAGPQEHLDAARSLMDLARPDDRGAGDQLAT